jgi:hypothetical protein
MTRRLTALGLVLLVVCGCAGWQKERELASVAKDWSMVVRASQVMPVYPLTEDMQPGDVFLVQLPVDEQQRVYREKGFLAFDNLIDRLNPAGFGNFYAASFGAGGSDKRLPKHWLTPGEANPWSVAPSTSFPTYSFSVKSGGGFSLALPVQGVPVGLSLLGGQAAQGTITIADAHTYGVDTMSLYADLLAWARGRSEFLSYYAPSEGRQNYLRVVTRVFLTGRLNVSLQSGGETALGASVGAPKPLDLVVPTAGADPQKTTLEGYAKNIAAINKMIEEGTKKVKAGAVEQLLPGGSIKVAAASAGSISLVETFKRPLVIGYLGFDVPIGADGILGPPIPTHALLERALAVSPQTAGQDLLSTAALRLSHERLSRRTGDARAASLVRDLNGLQALVPETYPTKVLGFRSAGGPLTVLIEQGQPARTGAPGFSVVTTYRGQLIESIRAIRLTQGSAARPIDGFASRTPEAEAFLQDQLAGSEAALDALNLGLRQHNLLLKRANEYASTFEE